MMLRVEPLSPVPQTLLGIPWGAPSQEGSGHPDSMHLGAWRGTLSPGISLLDAPPRATAASPRYALSTSA